MRELLLGPVAEVAPRLLGTVLTSEIGGQRVAVRLVEVEAYAGEGEDPASHAHRGRTRRNAAMFGPPGTAYVYFTYGMHWCLNVVVGDEGRAAAVLLRAGGVVAGEPIARERRRSPAGRAARGRDLARGPARLCQALGVDGSFDGVDLVADGGPLWLTPSDEPTSGYASGPRVGVTKAAERAWRFWLPDEPTVSAYRGPSRADRRQR